MKKFIKYFIVLVLLLGIGRTVSAQNLLQNPDFENFSSPPRADAWSRDYWKPDYKTGITDLKKHHGKHAAFLQCEHANDFRLVQKVKVEPDTVYRFAGWVATRNVSSPEIGANLCVMGGFVHSSGNGGDSDWHRVELVFRTRPKQTEVTVGVRLGYYSKEVSGLAFFDDLCLERVTDPTVPYEQLDPDSLSYQPPASAEPINLSQPDHKIGFTQTVKWAIYLLAILLFYLLLFLGLANADRIFSHRDGILKSWDETPGKTWGLFWLFVFLALLVRIPLLGEAPFVTDLGNFKSWALRIASTGPITFYAPGYYCDYPPGSLYILWFVGRLAHILKAVGNEWILRALIKLPSFACDVATAWLIFSLFRKKNERFGLVLAIIYLFLPAVIYNSAYWGQMDSYYVLLVLGAFYLLVRQDRPEWAAVAVAVAFLTKAQTIAFIPLFLFYLFINYGWRRRFQTIGVAIAAFILIILPFNLGQGIGWIADLYRRQAELYPYASLNAGNFLALLNGNSIADSIQVLPGITYRSLGLCLFFLGIGWSCRYYYRKRTNGSFMAALFVSSFVFFMFFPRMHERYLFPTLAFSLVTIGYYKDKRLFYLAILTSISYLLNMHAVILKYQNLLNEDCFQRAIYILAYVHTGIFVATWGIFQLQLPEKNRESKRFFQGYHRGLMIEYQNRLPKLPFNPVRRDYAVLLAVAVCYGCLIFWRLGSWTTPQTGLNLSTPDSGIEVKFQAAASPRTVVWYDAEDGGSLGLQKYEAGKWIDVTTLSCNDYYLLKRQTVSLGTVERLRLVPEPSAGHLREVAFLDGRGRLIPVKQVVSLQDGRSRKGKYHPLFDEQKRILENPSYMNGTYFDEIYHGRTAYEFIRGTQVYENTHPPLGKDLIALGILIFGMNPFGIRFIPALAGVLLILSLFFLGRQVLKTRFGAYAVMLMGCLDFMPFVQSRYSTIDTISVLFITWMFCFVFQYLRNYWQPRERRHWLRDSLVTVIFFALGASVKWTAVYGFAGVFWVIALTEGYLLWERKSRLAVAAGSGKIEKVVGFESRSLGTEEYHFLKTVIQWVILLSLVAVPIYYLSYLPYLHCMGVGQPFSGKGVTEVIANQKSMYDYHSKLTATHPFASQWWGWPFDFKPLWIYMGGNLKPGYKASIVSLGNPLIWFLGVLAVVTWLYYALTQRRFSHLLLVGVCFASQYLPWVLVTRPMFIYHFFPVLPLFYCLIAAGLEPLWRMEKEHRKILYGLALGALFLGCMFYPALSGMTVPHRYINALRWFPRDWFF